MVLTDTSTSGKMALERCISIEDFQANRWIVVQSNMFTGWTLETLICEEFLREQFMLRITLGILNAYHVDSN